jgi:hypothetical protein
VRALITFSVPVRSLSLAFAQTGPNGPLLARRGNLSSRQMGSKLYVGNLGNNVTGSEFEQLFSQLDMARRKALRAVLCAIGGRMNLWFAAAMQKQRRPHATAVTLCAALRGAAVAGMLHRTCSEAESPRTKPARAN